MSTTYTPTAEQARNIYILDKWMQIANERAEALAAIQRVRELAAKWNADDEYNEMSPHWAATRILEALDGSNG